MLLQYYFFRTPNLGHKDTFFIELCRPESVVTRGIKDANY
jgi:hypothetical protein